MHAIIDEMVEHFGPLLNSYETYSSYETLRVEHLPSDFYKDLKLGELEQIERTYKEYEIDEIDRKILGLLSKDSSMHFLDISKKLGSSIDVVWYRIKNLRESGILLKCYSKINLSMLGYIEYLCTLKVRNVSKDQLDKLKNRLRNDKDVVYAFFDVTTSCFVFECTFKDAKVIDHLYRSLRKEYSNIIEKQDYFIITKHEKFNLFPKGLV